MSNPDPVFERLREIEALADVWTSLIRSEQFEPSGEDDVRTMSLIHALTDHVCVLAKAVDTLWHNDQRTAALPLTRIALEVATLAAWVAVAPGAERAVSHEAQRHRAQAAQALHPHVTVPVDENAVDDMWSRVRELDEHYLPGGRKVEDRLKELSVGSGLYATYRVFSEFVHPGESLLRKTPMDQIEDASLTLLVISMAMSIGAWVRRLPDSQTKAEFTQWAAGRNLDAFPEYVPKA
ncbi:hypothetical protein J7E29_08440 [Streptomyces sp. ISL-90]|nr:hypothetical protein [Streptomyces sp. ISL-90]